jgi:DinB superfamily
MNSKSTIINSLKNSAYQFNELISNLNREEFEINMNHKWSAGQDLVHLIKLLRILNIAYLIPKPLLGLLYGINKKEQRSFEHMQSLYKNALANGAKSPSIYIPKPVLFANKSSLIKKHQALNESFIKKINKLTEVELDSFRLPHPILGKVSLRELVLFTSFHTIHHLELLKLKLNKN